MFAGGGGDRRAKSKIAGEGGDRRAKSKIAGGGSNKAQSKIATGREKNSAVENRGSGGDGDGVILSSVVMVMVLAMWSMVVVMLQASFRFCDVVEEERKSARSKN